MERYTFRARVGHRRRTGIVAILGAVFLLSLSDALVKFMSDRLALGQLILVRSVVAALLIGTGRFLFARPRCPRPVRQRWVWLRSLCLTAMWACYYAALPWVSFPLAAACYYTAPLWMAVLSRLLLKETVGRRQWLAIFSGLVGVILVLRPGAGTVSAAALLPLGAAFLYALAAIITRSRCGHEDPLNMALNLNVTLAAAGAAVVAVTATFVSAPGQETGFLLSAWPALHPGEWALLAGLGVLLAVIATAVAVAYQLAPAPVIGVFDNTYLIFAAFWGVVILAETPHPGQAVGMALIGGGAVLALISRSRNRPARDGRGR